MDHIVRRATEIGGSRIVPLETAHSMVRLPSALRRAKVVKWQSAAIEACKQSGNSFVPEIAPVQLIDEWVAQQKREPSHLCLVASLGKPSLRFRHMLKSFCESSVQFPDEVTCLIGPEGDFSPTEYRLLKESGYYPLALARHILRVETAAVYALSLIDYEISLR